MLIIDAHLDLSWNALQWNRDLAQSAYTLRGQERAAQGKGRDHNKNLELSVRNIDGSKYLPSEGLNVEDILGHDTLLVSKGAIERLQEVLG